MDKIRKFRTAALRKPLFSTDDSERAEQSAMQWSSDTGKPPFTLSALGIINGPLPRFLKLVLIIDQKTHKLHIVRRWWN